MKSNPNRRSSLKTFSKKISDCFSASSSSSTSSNTNANTTNMNMATSQFTAKELRELASCLHLRVDPAGSDCLQIRYLIDHLPRHLRASKMASFLARAGLSRKLCYVHDGLHAQVVSLIFDSLRTEVIDSVKSATQYTYLLGPDENMALDRTAGIEGMWNDLATTTNSRLSNSKKCNHTKPWKYQLDQCPACMLSRVASNPAVLRELRTLILAKMDDKGFHLNNLNNHQHETPLVLLFINEWISLTDQKDDLFYLSGQRAAVIKQAKHEWRVMQTNDLHSRRHCVDSNNFFSRALSENTPEQIRFSDGTQPPPSPPSLSEASTTPAQSSSLSRPPSRSAHEFLEVDSLLQNSAAMTKLDLDFGVFRLPRPDESYTTISSTMYDYPKSSPQFEEDLLTHFRFHGGALSDYMHDHWSSTEALQDPRSRLPPSSTRSSVDTLTSFTLRPEFHELHISPSESETSEAAGDLDGSGILPPLRTHSPFLVPPCHPSTFSPYGAKSGWSGNGQEQMFDGTHRLVDGNSGRGDIKGR